MSAVPDEQNAEVGELQNTFTNLGASIGTELVGAVLIGSLTTSFIQGVTDNPAVPAEVSAKATVEMSGGVPFISDADRRTALEKTDLSPGAQDDIVAESASARLAGLRSALGLVAILTMVGLLFSGMLPRRSLRADRAGAVAV